MCNYSKRKHSCMECKHFRHSETVVDGYTVESYKNIEIRTPKYKEIPVHYGIKK